MFSGALVLFSGSVKMIVPGLKNGGIKCHLGVCVRRRVAGQRNQHKQRYGIRKEMNLISTLASFPWGFPGGSVVRKPPANAEDAGDKGSIPGSDDALEEEMATHSRILAWEIPWTEEPGRATVHEVRKSRT